MYQFLLPFLLVLCYDPFRESFHFLLDSVTHFDICRLSMPLQRPRFGVEVATFKDGFGVISETRIF